MSIRLVVFDIAGTTVQDDGAVNTCLRDTLAAADVVVDAAMVDTVMGEPKPVAIAKLLALQRDASVSPGSDEVLELYATFEARMIAHYANDPGVRPAPGAEAAFRILKAAGIRVALDTGFNRTVVDTILHRLGWSDRRLIDATVASDEVDRGRPFPDLIDRAMLLTGTTHSAHVAKVGDTPADLLEGVAAKCFRVIGITTGSHSRASLAAHPHTHLVDHLDEVPPLCLMR
jgi:phosphonatase-like hydrolase